MNEPIELQGAPPAILNWRRQDMEQALGFTGGRYTTANTALTLIAGALLTAAFFAIVIVFLQPLESWRWISDMFLERGPCQYATMFLFFWALSILFVKWRKLAFQHRALEINALPTQGDFVLTPTTARSTLQRIHGAVDDPKHFVLLNRIERAIANLNNFGQVSDVSSILQTQAAYDEEQVNSSYGLLHGFVWAIPVIGFIGTVLGLSQAIGAFGATIKADGGMDGIRESLQGVTAGLATAFETTLVALVCALILQLLITFLQNRELVFLDCCSDYCHANVVSRLRLTSER